MYLLTSKLCRCGICGLGLLWLALASADLGPDEVGCALLLGALAAGCGTPQ